MKLREFPKVVEIYRWASEYTAETAFEKILLKDRIQDFYVTDEFKRIMFKVLNQRRGLIGILGLQGSGKTRTLIELERRLWKHVDQEKENVIHVKWGKDVSERLLETDLVCDIYNKSVKQAVLDKFEFYGRARKRLSKLGKIPDRRDIRRVESGDLGFEIGLEYFLTKTKVKELKKQAIYRALGRCRYILIDMPDYTKSTAHSMNRDIDKVQELWQKLQAEWKSVEITFVIAFQKEMVMKHPHFWLGKLDIITLKPLKPEQLIEAYKLRNKTIEPFAKDALKLIGELSRGIFRRFLKYTQITIEKNPDAEVPVTCKYVNNAITEDLLIEDMELELSDIFRRKDKKTQAVRTLNFLRQNPKSNMKTIAEKLNLSQNVVQRLIQKLDGYQYVQIERGEGREKLVSLKL